MSESIPSPDEMLRKAVFVPCDSKMALWQWILVYLGLDFPDTKVDPTSTSSPMDVIWEIYSKALKNDDENFDRILVYAARDSFKTLGAAILEVLAVVHLERSVAHMAAIVPQAQKAQSYVRAFFQRPYLKDYIVGDNITMMEFLRYYDPKTGDNLTEAQFKAVPAGAQSALQKKYHYIKVVTCTLQGANSEHVPFFVIDEVDVIPKQHLKAYDEAQAIPCTMDGKLPITLLISTRKFNFGKVQQEIDATAPTEEDPDGSGLQIRHWNLLDVTARCDPERHLPNEPKVPIYYSEDTLKALSEERYNALTPETQRKYTMEMGYAGCLKNCRLYAVCRGRLATGSQPWYLGSLLKPVAFTLKAFKKTSPAWAKAQWLCWKPGTEGLIYGSLEPETHLLTAAQIYEKILGEKPRQPVTREDLLALMKARGIKFIAGIDWGFTHNMAITLIAVDSQNAYVVGHWSKPELDPVEKLEVLTNTIKPFEPIVYPDTEAPDMNKLLKKNGFRVRDWVKGPGSVRDGIEAVRRKLSTAVGDASLFFLAGDEGVGFLFRCMGKYHWAIGADGRPSDEPDDMIDSDTPDDSCDSVRYGIMNTFRAKGGKVMAAPESSVRAPTPAAAGVMGSGSLPQGVYTQKDWAKQVLSEFIQGTPSGPSSSDAAPTKGKKGGFIWDL